MQWPKASVLVFIGLAAILAWARPMFADDPEPSRDPAVVKAQLRQASLLCKRMAQEIQALPPDDTERLILVSRDVLAKTRF